MAPIFTGGRMGFAGFSAPIYTISASTTSVNEGSSVIFTVNTINVADGTRLYWTTNTVSGTVNTSDFSDSATSGSVVIVGGVATITRTLSNDTSTEGTESFQLQIRTESTSGTVVATSSTVTISDTSLSISYATLVKGAYQSSTITGGVSWTGTVTNDVGGVSSIPIPTNRKTYIEILWTSNGGGNPGPGVCNGQNTELGLAGPAKGWWRDGGAGNMETSTWSFSSVTGGSTNFSAGASTYLGIAMDNVANSITFYRNGTAIFQSTTGWTSYSDLYFHWQNNGSGTDAGTFNFGATPFQYPLSGFVGLYA